MFCSAHRRAGCISQDKHCSLSINGFYTEMYIKASQIFPEKQDKIIYLKLVSGSPVFPPLSKNSTWQAQGTMLIFLRAEGVHLEIGRKDQVSTSRRLYLLCCSDTLFLWKWKVFLIYQNHLKPVYLSATEMLKCWFYLIQTGESLPDQQP